MRSCQVLWLVHEARSRLVLPFISQLRRQGFSSDLHFLEQPREEFLEKVHHPPHGEDERQDTHTFIVFYSYEDFLYAKGAWSWEAQESKPAARLTSPQDVIDYQHDQTTLCCIHDHLNEEKISLHEDLVNVLNGIQVFPDETRLIEFITEHYGDGSKIDKQLLHSLLPTAPLPLIPLAERVVIIRHAQRLDEVHPNWSRLALRPQDSPLSPKGISQSRYLGKWLSRQSWARQAGGLGGFFSSPFVRTVQTAHYALEEMEHELAIEECDEESIKVEFGLAEGASWLGRTGKNVGLCQTPWHLGAADLYGVSARIDLDYESLKTPLFMAGETYPGRPIELEPWYDRCAQAVWRLVRLPSLSGKTLILVTHGGCVDNIVHTLSGNHLGAMPTHTCVTSLVRDPEHGNYHIEKIKSIDLDNAYLESERKSEPISKSTENVPDAHSLMEIKLSEHHLPPELRTFTVVSE